MEATKTTKRNMLAALIIVMGMIIIGISISYAYYNNSVVEENEENQGVSVSSGNLTINFATSATIKAPSVGLIEDSEVTSSDLYTEFSIAMPSDSKVDSSTYNLFLTNIMMTNNLKSSDLKWALYDSTGTNLIRSGDFGSVTLSETANDDGTFNASDIKVLENQAISKGDIDSYKLFVWLSYDPVENQNNLLNGKLSVKVGFNAVSK